MPKRSLAEQFVVGGRRWGYVLDVAEQLALEHEKVVWVRVRADGPVQDERPMVQIGVSGWWLLTSPLCAGAFLSFMEGRLVEYGARVQLAPACLGGWKF